MITGSENGKVSFFEIGESTEVCCLFSFFFFRLILSLAERSDTPFVPPLKMSDASDGKFALKLMGSLDLVRMLFLWLFAIRLTSILSFGFDSMHSPTEELPQ